MLYAVSMAKVFVPKVDEGESLKYVPVAYNFMCLRIPAKLSARFVIAVIMCLEQFQ